MKLLSILFYCVFIVFLCFGCNNQNKQGQSDPRTNDLINAGGAPAGSDYEKGARLLAKNDCLTCHSIDKKIVGPSYIAIAKRYHNDQKYADYLSNTVVKGSRGIWGNEVMTPHDNVPYDDIKEMLKYILSLKENQ